MIARYDGEKLNDYVIEGLPARVRPGFFQQSELFAAGCRANGGSSIRAGISRGIWIITMDKGRKKQGKSMIAVSIARIN